MAHLRPFRVPGTTNDARPYAEDVAPTVGQPDEDDVATIPVMQAAFAADVVREIWQDRVERRRRSETALPDVATGIDVLMAPIVFCSITDSGQASFSETWGKKYSGLEGPPIRLSIIVCEEPSDRAPTGDDDDHHFVFTVDLFLRGNLPAPVLERGFAFPRHSLFGP